jgi:hypothetical protein
MTTLLATRQERLNQEYHFTQAVGNFETTIVTEDNLAFFCGQDKDDGMSLPVVASPEVINEWTTLPMPTNEHWKQALMLDQDIAHVITRMEQQLPPLYAALISKSYYSQWSKGKFVSRRWYLVPMGTTHLISLPLFEFLFQGLRASSLAFSLASSA